MIAADARRREFERITQIRGQIVIGLLALITRNRPIGIIGQRIAIEPLGQFSQGRIAALLHGAQDVGDLPRNRTIGFPPGIDDTVEPRGEIRLE